MRVVYIENPASCPYNLDDWCCNEYRDNAACFQWHPDFPEDCPLDRMPNDEE